MIHESLSHLIKAHQAVVGVIGLGYVGLPFAVEKAKVGYTVIGVDDNQERVSALNRGESYVIDVSDEQLQVTLESGLLSATTDFEVISKMDVIVVAVPTPLTKNLTPDLRYVERVTKAISRHLRPGQLVCLESTTYPGTTSEVMWPILEQSGLRAEEHFFLAHSPERVDPGNKRYTTTNTSKVVGGVGPRSLEVATQFYSETIEHVVPVSSAETAEMVKVFENTFRAVNIALVNELTLLCDRMGLDVWEVLDAAFTKPFGILPFYPGPGVGGHCIPLDPHYLEWKAREYNFTTRFIGLAGEINRRMPEFVREKSLRILGRLGVPVSAARILALGVAYKRDLSDHRESPAIEVIELLEADGVFVDYYDPFVPSFRHGGRTRQSVDFDVDLIARADLVIILTDHSGLDYSKIVEIARHTFDTRNATKALPSALRHKITKL